MSATATRVFRDRDYTPRTLAAMGREDSRSQTHSRQGQVFDRLMLGAVALLVGLGVVVVYSSSAALAARAYHDAEHFLGLQLKWLVLGSLALVIAARIPGSWLRRYAVWIFAGAVVLCAIVLIPGVGRYVGGARRWLAFGALGFQPSELAKIAVVLALSAFFARQDEQQPEARVSLLVPVALVQVPVLLILAEPDLGTALVIELIMGILVFSAGLRLRTLAFIGLAALPVFYHLVVSTEFRLLRVLSFIDPWAYRSTTGYQVTEALISIGSGGVTGVGLGGGMHKLFFLPEAHTDFVFAILAEELGLLGVTLLVSAFGVLLWRGVRAALRASGSFDAYLAMGISGLIGIPAVFNLLVATGLLPTKGLPLPLISYGGSNLLATLFAIGLLLRIEREGRGTSNWESTS